MATFAYFNYHLQGNTNADIALRWEIVAPVLTIQKTSIGPATSATEFWADNATICIIIPDPDTTDGTLQLKGTGSDVGSTLLPHVPIVITKGSLSTFTLIRSGGSAASEFTLIFI